MRKILICIFLFSANVYATPRCPLDVTSPAITQGFIPVHGGSLQGISGYNNPSEWPYFSFQEHVAPFNDMLVANAVISEAGIILYRDDLGHQHDLEICFPYGGEWPAGMRQMTLPVRVRQFHVEGSFTGLFGDLVRQPSIWNSESSFIGNPMDVTVANGIVTYDVDLGIGSVANSNIPRAANNGWTNFRACMSGRGMIGGVIASGCGFTPMWTKLGDFPVDTDFLPMLATQSELATPLDPITVATGQSPWGKLSLQFVENLPVLAPFNTTINLFNQWLGMCATYTGVLELTSTVKCEMRIDMDLHEYAMNHNPIYLGKHLNSKFGVLDPSEIGTGIHTLTFLAQTNSGPGGILNVAGPNELQTSLLSTTIEVGDGVSPPLTCQDPNATNFGGPLPCTYPVIPIWNLGTVFWHDKVFELCPGNNPNDLACVIQ